MPGISAAANTYNCPNYVGELFAASPEDTPLLSAIGGLTGGTSVGSTVFTWQGYDLRDADDARQRNEGADAPAVEARARFSASNVLEIHQETFGVTYTKQGATRQVAPATGQTAVQLGNQPVGSEVVFQQGAALKQIARDVEKGFITGTYNLPTDATTARRTRGLLAAITTNDPNVGTAEVTGAAAASTDAITLSAHGLTDTDQIIFTDVGAATPLTVGPTYYVVSATTNTFKVATSSGGTAVDITVDGTVKWRESVALTEASLIDLMQLVWEAGGIMESETRTLITGAAQKRRLTKIFVTDKNFQEQTRNVGGVSVQSIETDFGRVNIMLDRYMPASKLVVASLEDLAPAFLEIPGKGHFFAEPLAKTGSTDKFQLYGEIGLQYGNEKKHGQITGLLV